MLPLDLPEHPAARLLTADAVRERCAQIMAAAERGETSWFEWRPENLAVCAEYVVAVIRENYPDLSVPFHSRWRHFETLGVDRWGAVAAKAGLVGDRNRDERARSEIDLAVTSVLLDAGAGAKWRYRDAATGRTIARSEGLGVASLALFAGGAFSSDPARPLRADAAALAAFKSETLVEYFQVGADNPLVGVEGRTVLLQRLGGAAEANRTIFVTESCRAARIGHLFDYLKTLAQCDDTSENGHCTISARVLLKTLLHAFGPVWPSRYTLNGTGLGDCWRHPAASGISADDPTSGFVPFHKLTQWMAYSLLEPLTRGGLRVTELDALTGLPEYRNGGLLIDLGVLVPIDPGLPLVPLTVDHPAVVEWRALTVIALDRLAEIARARLGLTAGEFPLARVLEGGTWAAGRKIAAKRRAGGAPPLTIVSDGTVF